MSDNIPFEIQVEILKWLPAKSLLQFRSVSKTWKSIIDSPAFIAGYSCQQKHLLVCYDNQVDFNQKYVSMVDDDSLPQHRVSPNLHGFVRMRCSRIIGSSHGLLCLYGFSFLYGMVVIWNVSIKKVVAVCLPDVKDPTMTYENVQLGFGVCRENNDPKIVKITQFPCGDGATEVLRIQENRDMGSTNVIPRQVEVFRVSSPGWRSPICCNLPRKSIRFGYFKVAIDGFLYWLATDRITMDDGFKKYNLIVSFDLTSEEFREITLPDSLASQSYNKLSMFNRRESLVVLEHSEEADKPVFYVWKMVDGDPKSFTKLFTVNVHTLDATVYGFKKSGEPIIEIAHDLGTSGMQLSFTVSPYMESLLLHDRPDRFCF